MATIALLAKMIGIHIFSNYYLPLSNAIGNADVRQSVLNGSKKRIYAAEYGYDMNNNVSKFTSSAGGVSMTERFDYTISLSKPARRRKYKVQNAVLCGGVFCA